MKQFILDENKRPQPATLIETSLQFKREDGWNRVARTTYSTEQGEVLVSTVFLSFDHNFLGGQPILYESMIFADSSLPPVLEELDQEQDRYHTAEEAWEGHLSLCSLVEEILRRKSIPSRKDGLNKGSACPNSIGAET